MALEIERKFLVTGEGWKQGARPSKMVQGYIPSGEGLAVRVRIEGDVAKFTLKGKKSDLVRLEYEYEIPMQDAQEILDELCSQPIIEKTRYYKKVGQHTWEIDVFEGENEGLVVAEIELSSVDEHFDKPDWVGEDVSTVKEYRNNYLATHPYNSWTSKPSI